jgi:hypothetical protein
LEVLVCLRYSKFQMFAILKGSNERRDVYGLTTERGDAVMRRIRKEVKK